MATLENIRKRGPMIAVVIGIALFAFIVGDMLSSGRSIFQGTQNVVAKINGNSLSYEEYNSRINETIEYYKLRTQQTALDENTNEQIRNSVWELVFREYALSKDLEKLGLGVSKEELFDMVQGTHVDQSIQQAFTNQETGVFDASLVMKFLKEMDKDETGNSKAIWVYLENEIKENRFYNKYYTLVKKGLYVTKAEAESEYNERNYIVDIEFASKSYASILDSSVAVTDEELKNYYKEHKKEYKQEETRDIAYVTFDVTASKEDSAAILNEINAIYKSYESTKIEDVEKFVNLNSYNPYAPVVLKRGDFTNKAVDSLLFVAPIGLVYGPYVESNNYRLLKLIGTLASPDSVKASHILISNQKQTLERANVIADSLMALIKGGTDFAILAQTNSEDPGSATKGGDLNWFTEGTMVKEFNDACFNGKVGDIVKVETQFGVHIIKITEQTKPISKVKVAYIDMSIIPSEKTYQTIYAIASKFAGENRTIESFDKAIIDNKLTKKLAPSLTPSTAVIAGLETPREVIRWAFKAEKGEISEIYELGNKYVVAALTEAREKGIAPYEQVKDKVEVAVRRDKKAEQIIAASKAKNVTDLQAVADMWTTTVMPASSVSFNAFSIAGAGYEPAILAKCVKVEKDKVIGPIKGTNGVYYFKVTSITPPLKDETVNWDDNKKRLASTLQSRTDYQAFEAIKKVVELVDNRVKFF